MLNNNGGKKIRSCGCPILGSVQDQVRQGLQQPGIAEGVPAHGKG